MSIRKFVFLLAIMILPACRSLPVPSAPLPAAPRGNQKIAYLAPSPKAEMPPHVIETAVPAPRPLIPAPLPAPTALKPASKLPAPVPPPVLRPALDLPDRIGDWRISRLSANEWLAVPASRNRLAKSRPSLMEDAIILSNLHARLQSQPGLRSTQWRTSCNSGNVLLESRELTPTEALAGLAAVIPLDKVNEARLRTRLVEK